MLPIILLFLCVSLIECHELNCTSELKFSVTGTFSIKNFTFTKDCRITLNIPNFSYIWLTNTCQHCEFSSHGFWSRPGLNNTTIPPNFLLITFYFQYQTTIEEITATRYDFDPFKTVHRITINSSEDPLLIQLNELKQGETYIYEGDSNQGLKILRPYCHDLTSIKDDSLIFVYNGTNLKTAKPIGSTTSQIPDNIDNCYIAKNGIIKGLILYVHKPYSNESNPEYAKMLIMDSSNSNYNLYVSVVSRTIEDRDFFFAVDKGYQYQLVLITEESPERTLKDFSFCGRSRSISPSTLPNIQVYSGWPGSNYSVLLASYSEETRLTTIPQRFGGKVRTFVIEKAPTHAEIYFISPYYQGSQSEFIHHLDDSGLYDVEPMYADSDYVELLDFVPIPGRTGFIRSNWMDGSYTKESKGVLQLQETMNSTLFSFTFTFEPNCAEDAVLSITAYKNGTELSYNLKCEADEPSLTIIATHLSAELVGDGVVNYEVTKAGTSSYLKPYILLLLVLFFIIKL